MWTSSLSTMKYLFLLSSNCWWRLALMGLHRKTSLMKRRIIVMVSHTAITKHRCHLALVFALNFSEVFPFYLQARFLVHLGYILFQLSRICLLRKSLLHIMFMFLLCGSLRFGFFSDHMLSTIIICFSSAAV